MVTLRAALFVSSLSWFVACHAAAPAAAGNAGPVWRACVAVAGGPSLRGLGAVDRTTAWVSGSNGTIARTTDGGATWCLVAPPGTAACDFRDVEALDANTAVAMVAGQPARVYRTTDGGASWRLVLEDPRTDAFFDGIAFAGDVGVLFGDPVDGAFCVWTTHDGGVSWTPVPREALPAPLPGEAAFAASGSCVAVSGAPGREEFWIATGGGPVARVLRAGDGMWSAREVPLRAGTASQGGFGLAVHGERILLVGGDYANPTEAQGTAACSEDGGHTWRRVSASRSGSRPGSVRPEVTEGVGGFRSAVCWIEEDAQIAVGSHGTTWLVGQAAVACSDEGFHCLGRAADGSVWAAGSDGRVATLRSSGATTGSSR